MRAIILIQSIIIVLGAYYIYTLSHAVQVEQSPTPTQIQFVPASTTVHEGYVPPTENPPKDEPVLEASSTITGPNDAGMEYPTMQ